MSLIKTDISMQFSFHAELSRSMFVNLESSLLSSSSFNSTKDDNRHVNKGMIYDKKIY